MAIAQSLHAPQIKPPFYQGDGNCGLHRYLDTHFINRFLQDMENRTFQSPQFVLWQNDERHSRYGTEPVLRLPLHRAFHIVSCEVVCDRLGYPALDPQKIVGSGFVVRRVGRRREKAWMLEDGEALGWQDAPTDLRDPDIHRRLCIKGVLHKREGHPSYSGEEVHPLHLLKTTDAAGKIHTLLYGYVPLGGFYYERNPNLVVDAESQKQTLASDAAALPWPFGFHRPLDQTWRPECAVPVDRGRPSKAFFELLRLLVNRYHLGEADIESNTPLENYCAGLWFYDVRRLPAELLRLSFDESNRDKFTNYRKLDLLSYLRNCAAKGGDNPLVSHIVEQEQIVNSKNGLEQLDQLNRLPASSDNGDLDLSLFLTAADAQEIRILLGQRLQSQTLAKIKEIPLPKFNQGAEDLYQIVPFVRVLHEDGKERIRWADADARSIPFRVAAPFDPEASRPSLIQMPSLADLKRGLAKGASMIIPADTFNLVNSLKMDKGVTADAVPDSKPEPGLGVQWICSFSLPVVTLIAMIILMIMISLLNIIFFWMPWVRICLPYPKMK